MNKTRQAYLDEIEKPPAPASSKCTYRICSEAHGLIRNESFMRGQSMRRIFEAIEDSQPVDDIFGFVPTKMPMYRSLSVWLEPNIEAGIRSDAAVTECSPSRFVNDMILAALRNDLTKGIQPAELGN